MDPDSRPLRVTVTDGRGRPIRNGGLARWLATISPSRARGDVTIALVTDSHVRQLNRTYRRKDRITDVLSFPADETPRAWNEKATSRTAASRTRDPRSATRRTPEPATRRLLGDIVIATGVARRQAREVGHAYAAELRVLALHGLLHLLGYDHEDPGDSGRMARVEARLRRKGALHEGLIGRARTGHRGGQRLRAARAAGGKRQGVAQRTPGK